MHKLLLASKIKTIRIVLRNSREHLKNNQLNLFIYQTVLESRLWPQILFFFPYQNYHRHYLTIGIVAFI